MRPDSVAARQLTKRLLRACGQAIEDYSMIREGERVMVCLSGGKDSYTMLDLLLELQKRAPVRFELHAVNLDQKQPGFPENVLPEYLEARKVPYTILEQDTYSVVREKVPEGKTQCGLCSRLRRGVLYSHAAGQGFTRIALGHHMDDALETLFLNMFYGGRIKSMPPKLLADDRENMVIRPLYYCRERDIGKYAAMRAFPLIPCTLCGSQDNLKRVAIKHMLEQWEALDPRRIASLARSLTQVDPSQLADKRHYDFAGLDELLDSDHLRRRAG